MILAAVGQDDKQLALTIDVRGVLLGHFGAELQAGIEALLCSWVILRLPEDALAEIGQCKPSLIIDGRRIGSNKLVTKHDGTTEVSGGLFELTSQHIEVSALAEHTDELTFDQNI